MALFNQAVGWLRRNRVLLPGVSALVRQVAEVRTVAERRLYATVANAARRADRSLPADLVVLLQVPDGKRISELERLRRPPTRTTGTSMAKALERKVSRLTQSSHISTTESLGCCLSGENGLARRPQVEVRLRPPGAGDFSVTAEPSGAEHCGCPHDVRPRGSGRHGSAGARPR